MTKAELASAVAEETEMTQKQATAAIDALITAIKGSLAEGNKVGLMGFGRFSVKERKARIGRNPRTGEELKIPARKVVMFSAGKGLKDAVL